MFRHLAALLTLLVLALPLRAEDRGRLLEYERIAAAGLPAEISTLGMDCDGRRLVDHMLHDKKMESSGTLPFLLMRGIGAAYMARDVVLADVAAFLDGELA